MSPSTEAKVTKKKTVKKEVSKSWYDYPQYYDLGFRDIVLDEANFLEKAFEKYISKPVQKVFEPGCGTGRLVVEMAKRGYDVTGLDLNANALAYCQKKLDQKSLEAKLIQGDMTHFKIRTKFDAAFNTLNTFRHLLTEEQAVAHLNLIADHLKKGGIYVLAFHLTPMDADLYGSERWSIQSGKTKINYSLSVRNSSRKSRVEDLRITMSIQKPSGKIRVQDEFGLRLYTASQVKSMFASVPKLELLEVYDFWYDINEPQKFDNEIVDSVFILRKK